MKQQLSFGKIVVLGFALFAMFFGAGNLILPPALGANSGSNWFPGFLMYIAVDAGLSVVALIAYFKLPGGFLQNISQQLSPKVAAVLLFLNTVCLGPLIAIPRTAATTFDIGIRPLLHISPAPWVSWVCGGVYFALVAILCLKPGKVVDIIGKILAPVMFVLLLGLIAVGILHPLGEIVPKASTAEALSGGLRSGYQTMDMLGAVLLASVTLLAVTESGVTTTKGKMTMVGLAGLVASAGLFIVYGGLAYIGATISGNAELLRLAEADRPGLLVAITEQLVGPLGGLLLGLIVAGACLTTAIGLVSACAQTFVDITKGKLPYRPTMLVIIGVSYVLSNLGTEMILHIAAPILNILFPMLIMLVLVSFLPDSIRTKSYAAPFGAGLAFIVTVVTELRAVFPPCALCEKLPLAAYGLGWLLPSVGAALVGALIGAFFPRKRKKDSHKTANDTRFFDDKPYTGDGKSVADLA